VAYVDQSTKAKLAPAIKEVCRKYGIKASLAVRNHSTLCLNIKSGSIDFIDNANRTEQARDPNSHRSKNPHRGYMQVNCYHYRSHYTGPALDFLEEVINAMKGPDYFDHSDSQTDYFHLSHYIDVNIGQWDKPYAVTK
jgi:hypothetical protein